MNNKSEKWEQIDQNLALIPAVTGQLSKNPICRFYKGPAKTKGEELILCEQPTTGRFLTIQNIRNANENLEINDLDIILAGSRTTKSLYISIQQGKPATLTCARGHSIASILAKYGTQRVVSSDIVDISKTIMLK